MQQTFVRWRLAGRAWAICLTDRFFYSLLVNSVFTEKRRGRKELAVFGISKSHSKGIAFKKPLLVSATQVTAPNVMCCWARTALSFCSASLAAALLLFLALVVCVGHIAVAKRTLRKLPTPRAVAVARGTTILSSTACSVLNARRLTHLNYASQTSVHQKGI